MYGDITESMQAAIEVRVQNKVVWALGTGGVGRRKKNCEVRLLLDLGAKFVYSVDKEMQRSMPEAIPGENYLDYRGSYGDFLEYALERGLGPDVVFTKWPMNTEQRGFSALVGMAPQVIYIGRNDQFTSCGPKSFWKHLFHRELERMEVSPHNTLLAYGALIPFERTPVAEEERAAFDAWQMGY